MTIRERARLATEALRRKLEKKDSWGRRVEDMGEDIEQAAEMGKEHAIALGDSMPNDAFMDPAVRGAYERAFQKQDREFKAEIRANWARQKARGTWR